LKPPRIALATAAFVTVTTALLTAPVPLLLPALIAAGVFSMSWNGLAFTAAAELASHARSGAGIGIQQTIPNSASAAYPTLFGALVASTTWRAGFALVALFPLAGYVVPRRVA
jgi:MFS family permease